MFVIVPKLSTDCLFPSARTTPLSNLPTEDPYASDIGLLLGVDKIFEYQLEKETDFLPAHGDGSQDELIEHLRHDDLQVRTNIYIYIKIDRGGTKTILGPAGALHAPAAKKDRPV